jgi:hypothetical protein
MTESDWATCREPQLMLDFLRASGRASARKLRLFFCACYRCVWPLLTGPGLQRGIEVAERYADGVGGEDEFQAALTALYFRGGRDAKAVYAALAGYSAAWSLEAAADLAYAEAAREALARGRRSIPPDTKSGIRHSQAALLRDIVGNSFRPFPAIDPALLTSLVLTLAQAAYDERQVPEGTLDPARLAVLADALEEAGAGGPVLDHLRGPGPHVRGCHVLDALLGKG